MSLYGPGDDTLQFAVASALDVHPDTAKSLVDAAKPLWDAMATFGMVDAWDGAECRRVLPQALFAMHKLANLGPLGGDINLFEYLEAEHGKSWGKETDGETT